MFNTAKETITINDHMTKILRALEKEGLLHLELEDEHGINRPFRLGNHDYRFMDVQSARGGNRPGVSFSILFVEKETDTSENVSALRQNAERQKVSI